MVVLLILLAHVVSQLQPVHFRHQPVGNQHADLPLFHQLQGVWRVVGNAYIAVTGISQGAADHHTAEFGVVYYEYG